MLQIRVGLVDLTGTVKTATMAAAASAINIQVTRDLPQFWNVNATVEYLPDPHSIPQGVWPVQLVDHLPPNEGGFHLTSHNQPYAKVVVTPDSDEWTVDASHETAEMLVDPYGNRLQTASAIQISNGKIVDGLGKFEYLVEACDPCEADACTYSINGVRVSDFITPDFYVPNPVAGARYSFNGAVTQPRQVVPGGYISWVNPANNNMEQILWLGAEPVLKRLGPATGASLRAFVDAAMRPLIEKHKPQPAKKTILARRAYRAALESAARERAKYYLDGGAPDGAHDKNGRRRA